MTRAADLKAGDYLAIGNEVRKVARIESKFQRQWEWITILFEDETTIGPTIGTAMLPKVIRAGD